MQIYANFHFKTMLTTFTVKVVAVLKKRGLLSRLFEKISEKKEEKAPLCCAHPSAFISLHAESVRGGSAQMNTCVTGY